MYWYNYKKLAGFALLSSLTFYTACKPAASEPGAALKYFDIKGYFSADSARLALQHKTVLKTITHNGITQTKKVKIGNWGQELDLFSQADINKPAWKDSYNVIAEDSTIIYRAKDPELKMHEMLIGRDRHQHIKWILIFNKTKNFLYQTTEKLTYYPDSLYLIEKDQHVKLMGNNHYSIEGVIER